MRGNMRNKRVVWVGWSATFSTCNLDLTRIIPSPALDNTQTQIYTQIDTKKHKINNYNKGSLKSKFSCGAHFSNAKYFVQFVGRKSSKSLWNI